MAKRRSKGKKFGICVGIAIIQGIVEYWHLKHFHKKTELYRQDKDRYMDNFQLLSHWLEVRNEGRSVTEYFLGQGYKNIAVYGMGELANRLCEELENTDVQIKYGIDREVCGTISRMDRVYAPDDELEQVDAIIVTPFYAMDHISEMLSVKANCPIVSLEEVIWSL